MNPSDAVSAISFLAQVAEAVGMDPQLIKLACVLLAGMGTLYWRISKVGRAVLELDRRVDALEQAKGGDGGDQSATGALKGALGVAVVLALCLPADAWAIRQGSYTPSVDMAPYTVYQGSAQIYGIRLRQTQNDSFLAGYAPLELEVTNLDGSTNTIQVLDDSVYNITSRKVRITKVLNSAVTTARGLLTYFIDMAEYPGELGVPVSQTGTPVFGRGLDNYNNGFNSDEETGMLLDPSPASSVCSGFSVVRIDQSATSSTSGYVQAESVLVYFRGRDAGDTADVNFTAGSMTMYWQAPGGTGSWWRLRQEDKTLPVGEVSFAHVFQLYVPGYYCWIPNGVTGAAKVRVKRHWTLRGRKGEVVR